MEINLHDFLERSTENGPGVRAVIWVQGCTLGCSGCFNPDTHNMGVNQLISVHDLAKRIFAVSGIEGITISGGEPFLQAAPLAELGARMQQNNLGVIVFSGFPYEDLIQAGKPDWNTLLSVTDLLIAGPFIPELSSDLALRGSSNQTLNFISGRYTQFQDRLEREKNSVEIVIDESGQVIVTGFPGQEFLP